MNRTTASAQTVQKKRESSGNGRLVFGYILQLPDDREADTRSQVAIITAEAFDFVFHDAVSYTSNGSPMPAFGAMLAIAAPGDIVLVDEAARLGPLLSAISERLESEGLELIFVDEHYEAGRGK